MHARDRPTEACSLRTVAIETDHVVGRRLFATLGVSGAGLAFEPLEDESKPLDRIAGRTCASE